MQASKFQKRILAVAMALIAAISFAAYLQPSLILNLAQNLSLC